MKSLILILMLLIALGGMAQSATAVTIRVPAQVQAGAAWSVDIQISNREVGEQVDLALFNGLMHLTETAITGTGGVARWDIPLNRVTQSGESLIIARYAGEETRRTVQVLPGRAAQADVITTANALSAYGDGRGTLIVLLRDLFGNPPRVETQAALTITYPGGLSTDFSLPHQNGLAWTWFDSQGSPGRVRVHASADQARADLELRQVPGEAASVSLRVSPTCAPSDGRDMIRLTAQAADDHHNPVVDGTLIRFSFGTGFAYGRTSQGQASVSIPAPLRPGLHRLSASSGSALSQSAWLRITDEVCP